MAKIISVVNQKGGTGKSACAANLGVGLALMDKKALVVDADPQSDVSAGFGFRDCDNSNETLTTLMEMVLSDEDIPEDYFIQHTDEVLIPVEASYFLIKGLQQLLKAIGKVRRQINPKLQIAGILFSMVDAHTNDARNMVCKSI